MVASSEAKQKHREGEVPFDGGRLRIVVAADRNKLYVLRYKKEGRDQQLLQLRADTFEQEEQCERLLKQVMASIASGDLKLEDKEALYKERDKLVASMGGRSKRTIEKETQTLNQATPQPTNIQPTKHSWPAKLPLPHRPASSQPATNQATSQTPRRRLS